MQRTLLTLTGLGLAVLFAASTVVATGHEAGPADDEQVDHATVMGGQEHARPDAAQQVPTTADELDPRVPVAMLAFMAQHQKEQMRDHLLAIQEIVAALADENWQELEAAASRIGYSDAMAGMCEHMGAATPGFSDVALRFHRTADTIAEAARRKDSKAVLEATAATVSVCTGCHATYKQRVVDEAEWQRLTGTGVPAPGMHHPSE